MLKQRIITAIVIGAIFIFCLFSLSTDSFAVLLGLICMLAAWEWSKLVFPQRFMPQLIFCAVNLALLGFLWWQVPLPESLILIAAIYWIFNLLLLAFFQEEWLQSQALDGYLQFSGVFVLPSAWLALVLLHEHGPVLFLFMFVLIWLADSAAYFTGKRFGKTKLAATLSPGKTREGLWGAMIAGAGLAVVGVFWLPVEMQSAAFFVMLCLICVLISVVGDLFESLLKRNAGVKDSGNILPGHGGLLDRVDSVLAAAPVFLFGYHWMLA